MRARDKKYSLDQCALYRCSSRRRLLKLLQTSSTKYDELRGAANLYKIMQKPKKNGGVRTIQAPRGDLKRIQKRISELLMRVEPPNFLMSPVRGRSNVDNADRHRYAPSFRLLDVADFYPSCSANKVAEFFAKILKCPPDVTATLVWLTTREGVLPQGSPASPVLAYRAYRDMWTEIDEVARCDGCELSVYVDDITVSSSGVRGETIHTIKQILRKHGHRTKDAKEESRLNTPVTVTGVVLREGRLLLPNAQHRRRHVIRKALEGTPRVLNARTWKLQWQATMKPSGRLSGGTRISRRMFWQETHLVCMVLIVARQRW